MTGIGPQHIRLELFECLEGCGALSVVKSTPFTSLHITMNAGPKVVVISGWRSCPEGGVPKVVPGIDHHASGFLIVDDADAVDGVRSARTGVDQILRARDQVVEHRDLLGFQFGEHVCRHTRRLCSSAQAR